MLECMGNAGNIITFIEYIFREIKRTVRLGHIHVNDELPSDDVTVNSSKTLDILNNKIYFLLTISIIQETFRDCASSIKLHYIHSHRSTKVQSSRNTGVLRVYYCLFSDCLEKSGIWIQNRKAFHLKPGDYISEYTSTPTMMYNNSDNLLLILAVDLNPDAFRKARPKEFYSSSNHGVFMRG